MHDQTTCYTRVTLFVCKTSENSSRLALTKFCPFTIQLGSNSNVHESAFMSWLDELSGTRAVESRQISSTLARSRFIRPLIILLHLFYKSRSLNFLSFLIIYVMDIASAQGMRIPFLLPSNFYLQYQYVIKLTGDENTDIHHLSRIS